MFGNLRDLRIWAEQLTLIMAGKIFLVWVMIIA
jgi:hypothetical protein